MINKDYIMRIVERLGRALARILYMRQANQNEEALIYIDDLFMRTLGIGSGFINSVSDEMLLAMISPLGAFNIEKCLFRITPTRATTATSNPSIFSLRPHCVKVISPLLNRM